MFVNHHTISSNLNFVIYNKYFSISIERFLWKMNSFWIFIQWKRNKEIIKELSLLLTSSLQLLGWSACDKQFLRGLISRNNIGVHVQLYDNVHYTLPVFFLLILTVSLKNFSSKFILAKGSVKKIVILKNACTTHKHIILVVMNKQHLLSRDVLCTSHENHCWGVYSTLNAPWM